MDVHSLSSQLLRVQLSGDGSGQGGGGLRLLGRCRGGEGGEKGQAEQMGGWGIMMREGARVRGHWWGGRASWKREEHPGGILVLQS